MYKEAYIEEILLSPYSTRLFSMNLQKGKLTKSWKSEITSTSLDFWRSVPVGI